VLDLSLCCGISVRTPAGDRLTLPSRKSGLLLAFLALQRGGRATREQAIARLWSDRGEAQARASMRQELLGLRKWFAGFSPSPLLVDGEELALDFDAVQVDAVTFERLCRSGTPDDLAEAVDICSGEFLASVPTRDPGGEEWLRGERGRLRALKISALRRLLAHHAAAGAIGPATDIARRLVDCEPLGEDAHRALVALLAAAGGRAQALSQYEESRARFRRELDVDLDGRTVALGQRIREASDGLAPTELLRLVALDFADQVPELPTKRGLRAEAPAIAVLPFANCSDRAIDNFGDGLVDGITGALSRVRSFFVISRGSMEIYRHELPDLPRIGTELGVRYVVMGSMQHSGGKVRLRTQLVETATSGVLWSDQLDARLTDVFDLQDRITERVVGAIAPSVSMAEIERARRKRPESLAAYDYAMRALAKIWMVTPRANAEAMHLTREAIRLDPNYATAYAYASWCQFWAFANGWTDTPELARAEAFRLINCALQLDGNDPNVLTIAALNSIAIAHDIEAARAYVDKALRLDPNFTWGWNRSGYIEVYRDNIETALAHFERAALLSPFDPLTFNRLIGMALAHYCAGRHEEAARLAEQARQERPGLPWAYRVLIAAYVELGRLEDARRAVVALSADVPSQTVERILSSMPFGRHDVRERFARALSLAGIPSGAPARLAVEA
jgi:TolB-like protein/DNA-binding SARP family transcriptional activator